MAGRLQAFSRFVQPKMTVFPNPRTHKSRPPLRAIRFVTRSHSVSFISSERKLMSWSSRSPSGCTICCCRKVSQVPGIVNGRSTHSSSFTKVSWLTSTCCWWIFLPDNDTSVMAWLRSPGKSRHSVCYGSRPINIRWHVHLTPYSFQLAEGFAQDEIP